MRLRGLLQGVAGRERSIVLAGLGLLAGCASCPPPDRHFGLRSPLDAMRYLRYAVETGYWGEAYGCLTRESRDKYSRMKFEVALRFGREKTIGGHNLAAAVVGMEYWLDRRHSSADEALFRAIFADWAGYLVFRRDAAGMWRFDLLDTIDVNVPE